MRLGTTIDLTRQNGWAAGAPSVQRPAGRYEISVSKRILDVALASVALVLLAPVMALIAFLIRLTEGGPVIYAHRRVGTGGAHFDCLKFRTMHPDSAEMLEEVLRSDPIARSEWQANYKFDRDHRVTALGNFLRRTSLDELPQLFNVLRGEMSLVGPRPVTLSEVSQYGADFEAVTSVRPGLTGLWQVSGRSETTYEERVALDLLYVRSATIWMDLVILARTVRIVLLQRGAA
ncbi:sugar transferase [Histidinibacterium aquaticum]|uniref:Sugar transferase n=1 Tax=Histidinibacterium aquaticum TaxID=2613962 RepID=A0A5J5GPR7_9RHOB|nr:sugar transferase [Histidinibacterium aquaticum]KAA9009422.1 sugar transferase [Histidinibacterium aquaticum]